MNTEEEKTKDNTESQQIHNQEKQIEDAKEETTASLEQVAETDPEVEVIVDKLEPDEVKKVNSVIKAEAFSGPLPHPSHLEKYAEIYDKSPEIIFDMAEKQQNHRHYMEKTEMNKILNMEKLGIILGFILALFFLLGGFALIAYDKEVYGVTAVIIGLVTLFARKKSNSSEVKKENNESDDEPAQ